MQTTLRNIHTCTKFGSNWSGSFNRENFERNITKNGNKISKKGNDSNMAEQVKTKICPQIV